MGCLLVLRSIWQFPEWSTNRNRLFSIEIEVNWGIESNVFDLKAENGFLKILISFNFKKDENKIGCNSSNEVPSRVRLVVWSVLNWTGSKWLKKRINYIFNTISTSLSINIYCYDATVYKYSHTYFISGFEHVTCFDVKHMHPFGHKISFPNTIPSKRTNRLIFLFYLRLSGIRHSLSKLG